MSLEYATQPSLTHENAHMQTHTQFLAIRNVLTQPIVFFFFKKKHIHTHQIKHTEKNTHTKTTSEFLYKLCGVFCSVNSNFIVIKALKSFEQKKPTAKTH